MLLVCLPCSMAQAQEESIELVSYYPAPFGDYEQLSANILQVYNAVAQLSSGSVTQISDLATDVSALQVYKGLRVLNQLATPYDTTVDATDVTDYSELSSTALTFAGDAAFISGDDITYSAVTFLEYAASTPALDLRCEGDITLTPGDSASSFQLQVAGDFNVTGAASFEQTVLLNDGLSLEAGEIDGGSGGAIVFADGHVVHFQSSADWTNDGGSSLVIKIGNASSSSTAVVQIGNENTDYEVEIYGNLTVHGDIKADRLTLSEQISLTSLSVDTLTVADLLKVSKFESLTGGDGDTTEAFEFFGKNGNKRMMILRNPHTTNDWGMKLAGALEEKTKDTI